MLHIHLFGQLRVYQDDQTPIPIESRSAQELLGYLLLNQNRPHPRELLAHMLWGDAAPNQARAKLRKTLHQLQQSFPTTPLLLTNDWVQVSPDAEIDLDVAALERTIACVSDLPGEQLDDADAQQVVAAVERYQSDLLEGCYADWCLFERERLQRIYLTLLDKLLARCETRGLLEAGIAYGAMILRYDQAHEQTHQRLMRMHFLAGDRTTALRQYERCVAALRDELDAEPTELTTRLRAQILDSSLAAPSALQPSMTTDQVLAHLRQAHTNLLQLQSHLRHQVAAIECLLDQLQAQNA